MHKKLSVLLAMLFTAVPVVGQDNTSERVAEALLPLPTALRAQATVIGYELNSDPLILREGINDWICIADDPAPGLSLRCYHSSLNDFVYRSRQLEAEGVSQAESVSIRNDEYESGAFEMPDYALEFLIRGYTKDQALPWAITRIPFATAENTGLPTVPDAHRPWLMGAGTVTAHIMLPGN
jgi:hypothetical protein